MLIRAMVNAAKADGRLTREEQDAILQHLGGDSREAIAFLQRELDTALDVRDFAWSVPLGMEYKVYAISLSAIDLDTKSESAYLEQLAHGLRLPARPCSNSPAIRSFRPVVVKRTCVGRREKTTNPQRERGGLEPFKVGRDSITPIDPAYKDKVFVFIR